MATFPKLLSFKDASEFSGMTIKELQHLADAGKLRTVIPVHRKRKFIKQQLAEFMEKLLCQK